MLFVSERFMIRGKIINGRYHVWPLEIVKAIYNCFDSACTKKKKLGY